MNRADMYKEKAMKTLRQAAEYLRGTDEYVEFPEEAVRGAIARGTHLYSAVIECVEVQMGHPLRFVADAIDDVQTALSFIGAIVIGLEGLHTCYRRIFSVLETLAYREALPEYVMGIHLMLENIRHLLGYPFDVNVRPYKNADGELVYDITIAPSDTRGV